MNNLESDGQVRIYEINSGEVVAEYEGLEVYKKLSSIDKIKDQLLLCAESCEKLNNFERAIGFRKSVEFIEEYYGKL